MNIIKSVRGRLGVSQLELGKALGLTQGNVSHYEVGAQDITPRVAKRLIEYAGQRGLAIGFDHIYGGSPLPKTDDDPERAVPVVSHG